MWDAMWGALSSRGRDENMGEFVIRLVIDFIINFSLGLFMTVVSFLWGIKDRVNEFGVSLLSAPGLTVFSLAAVASISFAMSFVVGGYAVVTATVFALELSGGGRIGNGAPDPRFRVRDARDQ
jgi:hypothetical protein